jgi:hypothetical protein
LGTCDENADCNLPSFECNLFSEELQTVLGRGGICLPTDEALNEALDGGVSVLPGTDAGGDETAAGEDGGEPPAIDMDSGPAEPAPSVDAAASGDAG